MAKSGGNFKPMKMKSALLFGKEIKGIRKMAEDLGKITPDREKLSDEQIDLVKQVRDSLMTAANILVHV